ncbi:MAG: alpha/beta hydrolase [Desulfovibrio sp.]|nr:alpha/beta hydrolase [Desulfovibrio sp.]
MRGELMAILMTGTLAMAGPVFAATENPFGLVYANAIKENLPGKTQIHPVNYDLNGIKIAANVYTPPAYKAEGSFPAVVAAHPNGGVKEQVAGEYAQKLADAGYIAITADAAFQGASGGESRHTDKPYYRTEDIHGMIDYFSKYPDVDKSRIGALGICGGGGYTLNAAKSDKRLKAAATLSMFNSGKVRRDGFMESQVNSIQERLKNASEAREKHVNGGPIELTGNVDFDSLTVEKIAQIPTDLYREGMMYYGRTHRHPNSTFAYTTESLMNLIPWDANDQIELINAPLLMMAGDKADTLYMTEEAYGNATGAKSRELFLIPGATHIQTYYVPEYVDQAIGKLKEFYGKNL